MITHCKNFNKNFSKEMLKQCSLKLVLPKWILFRIRNLKLKMSSKVKKLFSYFRSKVKIIQLDIYQIICMNTSEFRFKILRPDNKESLHSFDEISF